MKLMTGRFWIIYSALVAFLIVGNYHEGTRRISQMGACLGVGIIIGYHLKRRN
jgi:hypothetical protein